MSTEVRTAGAVFHGSRSITAPPTWAQQAMWNTIGRMRPNDAFLNAKFALAVPEGRTVDDVCRAVGEAAAAHEALRTRYPESADGHITQVVERSGELPVTVRASDATPVLTVLDDLAERAFDHAADWPVRFAVLVDDGTPTHLLFVGSHLSFDGIGKNLLHEDLAARLAGERPRADRTPPMTAADLAIDEQSPAAQARNAAAVARWHRLVDTHDVVHFPLALHDSDIDPRWLVSSMSAPVVAPAVELIARRCRVTTPAVFMAATAVLVSALSGRPTVVLKNMISNRFTDAEKAFVGTISQSCATVVHVGGSTFDEVVTRTMTASVRGYSMGRYRLADIYDVAPPQLFDCFHNDLRDVDRRGPGEPPRVEEVTALREVSSAVPALRLPLHGSKFYLEVRDGADGPESVLIVDRRHLALAEPERLLLALAAFLANRATSPAVGGAVGQLLECLVRTPIRLDGRT
ncbi:condensation domain-containing protein [Umezawaea tangerina]|uniref:Condensation domain-containing protein n=1 Tax=Umezawaea tangerina TaxID=84725 RepID=A0A2T0T6H4_9PSEU|nr:condensation domain-containing protein [Umezawaea tangerina]PRY41287.1 condensation domain-containing protein [Umezawaea tangerina]